MMIASWLDVPAGSDFTLANLPFAVASFAPDEQRRCVTAVGDTIVDLSVLEDAQMFAGVPGMLPSTFSQPSLNKFMEHDSHVWSQVRQRLQDLFCVGGDVALSSNIGLKKASLRPMSSATLHLPAEIGDYTDFYSSREHATNVGTMFRGKDNALQPNWLHLPVGYHGRASTVFVSGTDVVRPTGQLQKDASDPSQGSIYGPCRLMDFELEVAFFVGGPPNQAPLSMDEAKDRIFGFCLMNDWSARDIQKWEYVPLGPFTAKNFATTISPWVVPTLALKPFACQASARAQTEPVPLEYLRDPDYSSYDISLEVAIQPENDTNSHVVCHSNFRNLYWNAAQQLVHHSVTGCVMRAGDLLASGTISGSAPDQFGSMLELSWKGSREVDVGNEKRKFLKDGDSVIMRGWCGDFGPGRVGFGSCVGKVLPASTQQELPAKETPRYKDFKLYSYWRSSSAWRVRIALEIKQVEYEVVPINLREGEQKSDWFLKVSPLGQVPVLEFFDGCYGKITRMTQSVAIFDFLDAAFPEAPRLIPQGRSRADALELVEMINSGTQPLQNLPLLKQIEADSDGKIAATDFAHEAIGKGLAAYEGMVRCRQDANYGPFSAGNFSPTIADAFLVPQLYNARRYGVDVETNFPILADIDSRCSAIPWFQKAHADEQPDREH